MVAWDGEALGEGIPEFLPDSHRADKGFPLGLLLAVITGVLYAASANLVSYVTHRNKEHRRTQRAQTSMIVDAVAFTGYVIGGLIVTAAYATGNPTVAVVNATMVATNLLTNMVLQCSLRIAKYSKGMRVGTFTFMMAVFAMIYDGPTERGDVDVFSILTKQTSLIWFAVLGFLLLASFVGVYTSWDAPMQSNEKILAWSILISVMGSGTDNVASTFGLLKGWTLYAVMGSYGAFSVVLLALSSKAPAYCEASTYVPLQLCIQLVMNMVTGVLIWEDHLRLRNVLPYMMDFALACLSVYLASDNVDLFAGIQRWQVMHQHLESTRFGCSVLGLLDSWRDKEERHSVGALKTFLDAGLTRGLFTAESIRDLVCEMQFQLGSPGASVPVVQWMEDSHFFNAYMSNHPEFAFAIRDSLGSEQQRRLRERTQPLPDLEAFLPSTSASTTESESE